MKVRKATLRDWLSIRKLIKKFPEHLLQDHLPRASEFFVALDDDKKIIGCCALVVYSKRLAEVRSLAVDSHAQGKGVASALIEACVASAKKRKIYELLSITGAKSLFEKQGFDTLKSEKYALIRVLG